MRLLFYLRNVLQQAVEARAAAAAASLCERANSQFVAATTTTIYLPSMMIGMITVVEFHCGTGEIQWIFSTCK